MADSAAVTVTTDYDAKARVRVLEAAMRKIMAPTCQCVSCVTLREALESAPSPQPSPPEVEREGEMPRCFDCGREMLAGEPHYMVAGDPLVDLEKDGKEGEYPGLQAGGKGGVE